MSVNYTHRRTFPMGSSPHNHLGESFPASHQVGIQGNWQDLAEDLKHPFPQAELLAPRDFLLFLSQWKAAAH